MGLVGLSERAAYANVSVGQESYRSKLAIFSVSESAITSLYASVCYYCLKVVGGQKWWNHTEQ